MQLQNYPQSDHNTCTQYCSTYRIHFPKDTAICMKVDVYFEIKLLKLE